MAAEFPDPNHWDITHLFLPAPQKAHRNCWPWGCCWLPADHITPLAMSQAASIALGGPRLPSLLPPAPSPKEQWENARLKLPMVTGVTGIKAGFHMEGLIHSKPTLQRGFRSSISLSSTKKGICSLCTNQHYFGEMKLCMPTMFSIQVAHAIFKRGEKMISSKEEVGWENLLRSSPTWIFLVLPWLWEMFWALFSFFREVQVDPLITGKKPSQEPYLLFSWLWCRRRVDGQLAGGLFMTPVVSGLALVFVSPKSDSNPAQASGKNPGSLTDIKLPLWEG